MSFRFFVLPIFSGVIIFLMVDASYHQRSTKQKISLFFLILYLAKNLKKYILASFVCQICNPLYICLHLLNNYTLL